MKNTKEEIQKLIDGVVKPMVAQVPDYKIDHPVDEAHGDISVNVAFLLAKKLKKAPLEIAGQIKIEIEKQKPEFIEKVEVVGGYINFWLAKEFLAASMIRIIEAKEQPYINHSFKGKKVMVEYTDPNPFKEFHIGHLYSNAVGESISRLFEALGVEVKRANYQGDVGMHVAKAVYGLSLVILNSFQDLPEEMLKQVQHDTVAKRAEFLGECYAKGAKTYEEDEKAKQEINAINKKIYEKSDPDIQNVYEKGRAWSLEYFEMLYKRLGTKFDFYYFESEVGIVGVELVREYLKQGVFEESEGAVIFPGEKHGLHNRVFINSLGLPTYEAKELGLNKKKYEDYRFDVSVIVTGNEINEYFKVLFKAMEQIIPEVAAKTKHVGHGMVRLPEGKMSSRSGNVITGEGLLNEAKQRILGQFKDVSPDISEQVAIAAVKYALLKSSIGRDIEFDFDTSISLEGNSGPYLQYTFVRTQSILKKSEIRNPKSEINPNDQKRSWTHSPTLSARTCVQASQDDVILATQSEAWRRPESLVSNLNVEELNLLRELYKFSEVVQEAGEKLAPHIVCNYLYNLAQKFNNFYQKHKIIGSENEAFRLQLTEGVGIVIKRGLYLLGISAPDRM